MYLFSPSLSLPLPLSRTGALEYTLLQRKRKPPDREEIMAEETKAAMKKTAGVSGGKDE